MEEEKKELRKEAYQDVKMYIANDWELSEETPEFFLLKRNKQSFGIHVLILFTLGIIFALFTFGLLFWIPNTAYWYFKKESKKILK